MNILTKKIPAFLCEKNNLILMVTFTAIYAVIFINTYQPFGSGIWIDSLSTLNYFLYSSLIVLIGFVVIALSRVVMYFWQQRRPIVYIQYVLWILVEVLFMAMFFTIIALAINIDSDKDAMSIFKISFFNTILILVLPYILTFLYFSWKEKNRRLEELDGIQPVDSSTRMINFYDEREVLRLSVMKSNILYLEAADNYICIYYMKKSGVTRFMLRNTLKAMESYLVGVDIVRCHRSYMVNLEYVSAIRRQRDGIFLELNLPEVPDIPLSNRYREKVDVWFKSTEK